MSDEFTHFLFLAEPFGFGPISSSIVVARQIKRLDPRKQVVFLGHGTSYQLAILSDVFDEVIFDENLSEHSFLRCGEHLRPCNCIVIANTYPIGVEIAARAAFICFFIDTLFWMWKQLPIDISHVEAYYIEEFHCANIEVARFGHSRKFKKVAPLIDVDVSLKTVSHPFLLVSLGGIDSSLYDFPVFYEKLICRLSSEKQLERFTVLICGGGKKFLRNEFKEFEHSRLSIECLGPREYMANLRSADIVLASAGLHGFYENYFLRKNAMFLPPQSYSQYLQLKYITETFVGVTASSFERLEVRHSLRENMPDVERINEVKRTNGLVAEDKILNRFFDLFERFCSGELRTDWSSNASDVMGDHAGPATLAEDLLAFGR